MNESFPLMSSNAARFLKDAPFDAATEWTRCERGGIRVLRRGEAGFPDLLAAAPDAPDLLYVDGSVDAGAGLAIVGSRRPTPYGRRMARRLAAEAARAGLVIVSGLARGIDTEAHRAAVEAGGRTWAVLGSGLDRVYPGENAALAREIVRRGGAVVSEFPLDASPMPFHFPLRNRIVAGLSWATVVVEGEVDSGSLITARRANDQGRDVFAVPGPADSPLSDGPLKLLREGASPATCLQDILNEVIALRRAADARLAEAPATSATMEDQKILKLLGSGTRSLEELLQESGMDVPGLATRLSDLELRGLIASHPGQLYAKR